MSFIKIDKNQDDFINRWNIGIYESDITIAGIFNSFPFIIFGFMYAPNIPAIYHELKDKNLYNLKKILAYGTSIASVAYLLTGIFGYITFVKHENVDEIMNMQNILKADYGDLIIIKICLIGVLFVVWFASPFALLPVKDSIEELIMEHGTKFDFKENFIVTLFLVCISYLVAILVPTFGDILTILGATTNSGIGFLIPIVFYLKIKEKELKCCSLMRFVCYIVFLTICVCSIITLVVFIDKKINN